MKALSASPYSQCWGVKGPEKRHFSSYLNFKYDLKINLCIKVEEKECILRRNGIWFAKHQFFLWKITFVSRSLFPLLISPAKKHSLRTLSKRELLIVFPFFFKYSYAYLSDFMYLGLSSEVGRGRGGEGNRISREKAHNLWIMPKRNALLGREIHYL